MDYFEFHAVSWRHLKEYRTNGLPFSCWIHLDRGWLADDDLIVVELIKNGCRVFMISGADSEFAHDHIDEIVIDTTQDLVLTMSRIPMDKDSAFQFISTRCPSGPSASFIISCFTSDLDNEKELLSVMANLVKNEINET